MTRVLHWMPRALSLMLAVVAGVALVAPRNTWFVFPVGAVWAATAVVLLAFIGGARTGNAMARAVARRPARAVALGTVLGGVLILAHLPLALIDFGWDARQVYWAVEKLADGRGLSQGGVEYFAKYPNNIPLLALMYGGVTIGSGLGLPVLAGMLAVQTAGMLVVLWCLGSTLVRLGRPGAVWPAQALATVLLGLNAQAAIPYSDLPTAALVALALWAVVRAWTGAGGAWWAVALAALVLAVSLKAYAVALALGALALVPALAQRRGRVRAGAVVLGVLATLVVGVVGVHAGAARFTELPEERRAQATEPYPVEHFLAMGTYDSQDPSPTRAYGAWNWEHASAMRHEPDPDVRREISRQKIGQQVGERGVVGNLEFLTKKVAWTWGDGTFAAHWEGDDRTQPGLLPGSWGQMQQWHIGSGEPYRQHVAPLVQGLWVAVLLITSVGLWRARAHPWVAACALTLLVLTAYLSIFETRARYLVALLPVLLLLTGLTAGQARAGKSRPAAAARESAHAGVRGLTGLRPQRTVGNTPRP
ncbi:hypothetical protein [Ornithinimicrobium pratense]|uniref:Glycosyltransferase RgtA/B/C/D-like domain-containing protein n=1 Tax=Ornithinimicrobium pratense TaxID=2593973 RepID=A0A5J6V2P8_9MICO|nr:hypothetical protein [Ornithinimicrobium pratense]QFG67947.1 hypothetical protein FY030_03740 [Ornithinimicrobium pratense]